MRRSLVLAFLAVVVVVGAFPGSSPATPPPVWGTAIAVPGFAALNKGGDATVFSVSCGAPGACALGGTYTDGSAHTQAFVASETSGVWGAAIEVPGTAALNIGGDARVYSVSCAAAGECVAGGYYTNGTGHTPAFVVSETGGVWHAPVSLVMPASSSPHDANVLSVSCAAVGACAAGGLYYDLSSDGFQAFVVNETGGVWGTPVEVPGTAGLNSGNDAAVYSVSCAAAGECAAGGRYREESGHFEAFVVSETGGVWHAAVEAPGTAALNSGGDARVGSVSCGAVGDCAAGGSYTDGSGHSQAFVARESGGVWHAAVEVPGTAALNSGGDARVGSVSCGAVGDCAAGGSYTDGSGHSQAFVARETGGVWHAAIEAPGTAALNSGGNARLDSVSCPAAGKCAAGGRYTDHSGHSQAFVARETGGVWSAAVEAPGIAALNSGGNAGVDSVSCATAGECAAAGGYTNGSGHHPAFVVDSSSPCVVPHVVGRTLSAARHALAAAYCGVGTITMVHSMAPTGRVLAQHPSSGTHLRAWARVALTVSRGA